MNNYVAIYFDQKLLVNLLNPSSILEARQLNSAKHVKFIAKSSYILAVTFNYNNCRGWQSLSRNPIVTASAINATFSQ